MAGLYGGQGVRSEAYTRYVICKEFGWSYYEYMSQPPFFIEEIILIMHQEAQKEKGETNRLEQETRAVKSR